MDTRPKGEEGQKRATARGHVDPPRVHRAQLPRKASTEGLFIFSVHTIGKQYHQWDMILYPDKFKYK